MKFFLNRIEPKTEESLYSFLYRTVIANHYLHINSLFEGLSSIIYSYNCNYLSKDLNWYKPFNEVIGMLKRNCDEMVLNRFDSLLFQDDVFGSQPQRFFYLTRNTKYCPECLKEDFYHRLFWDISFVTVCLKHKKFLIDQCPKCQKKIRMARIMKNQCTCGCIFSDVVAENKYPTKRDIKAQQAIQGLLLNQLEGYSLNNNVTLNSNEYFRFFILFCHIIDNVNVKNVYLSKSNFKKFNVGMKNKEPKNVQMMNLIATYTHQLITNSSVYLPKVLSEINNPRRFKKERKKVKMRSFNKIQNHKKGKIFKKNYIDYLAKLEDDYINRKQTIKLKPVQKEYLTIGEVTEIYKISKPRIQFLCKNGYLKLNVTNSFYGEVRLIEKKSVESYLKLMKRSLNKFEVSNILGLQPERIIDLVKRGLLKAIHGPKADGYVHWLFDNNEVKKMQKEILKNAQIIMNPTNEMVDFKNANFMLRHLNINTIDLLELVMKKRFSSYVLKNERNIKGMFISKKDLEEFIEKLNNKRRKEKGYNLEEFAERFNMDKRKVKKLIISGKLKAKQEINPNGTVSYFFDAKYVENLELPKY